MERKLRVEVTNPKTANEWEQKIKEINEFLDFKYKKKCTKESFERP